MRKLGILSLVLVFVLGFAAFVACNGDDDDDDSGGSADDDSNETDDDGADDDEDDDTGGDDDDSDDDAVDDDVDDDTTDDDDADDDTSADLIWQDPPASEKLNRGEALAYCENLDLDEHEDWRLPTISELRSLVSGCPGIEFDGDCGVTDDCTDSGCWNAPCVGCDHLGGPGFGGAYWPDGFGGEIGWYLSSTLVTDLDNVAWYISFTYGGLSEYSADGDFQVRCVRS